MALTDYRPEFPYKGNQVIISSGRVLLHSKDDAIFLFGKKAVSISTPGTLNIDASVGVTIAASTIELGLNAIKQGEPIAKASTLALQLTRVFTQLADLSNAIATLEIDMIALPTIVNKAKLLNDACTIAIGRLETIASTTTFTT